MEGRIALNEIDVEAEFVTVELDRLIDVGDSENWLHPVEFEGRQLASVHELASAPAAQRLAVHRAATGLTGDDRVNQVCRQDGPGAN